MKSTNHTAARVWGILCATTLVHATARADDRPATADSSMASETRYGLFNGLDHRSSYGQGIFPEPFLVDDSDLEDDEARFDWVHTAAGSRHSDTATAEVEKGFGLLTLELEIPYERDASPDAISQGFGNINLGARYPFYQLASANGFFDTTLGAAVEVGIPINSAVSRNPELVPKVFNDLQLGGHVTMQSILGYSTLLGGGDDGGRQTFEYGFDFGCAIFHDQLPLPGVQELIPVFELAGATELNQDDSGHNRLLGNIALRADLKTIGRVQPRLGLGFIFPISGAHADVHSGVVTSLVFEY